MNRTLLLTLCLAGKMLSQQPQPGQVATPGSDPRQSMSVKEKWGYEVRHLFDPEHLIFAGMGAAIDQGRDRPGAWGQSWSGFAERYGSHFGQYLIQRSIMYPVQDLDGEDPRYLRSQRTNYGGRFGDAFLHTVWRANDEGGKMPAYSEFFGDYGAAAVSRLWWPSRYHTGSAILIAGTDTVLIDGFINVFHEFTPDVKRWLHVKH